MKNGLSRAVLLKQKLVLFHFSNRTKTIYSHKFNITKYALKAQKRKIIHNNKRKMSRTQTKVFSVDNVDSKGRKCRERESEKNDFIFVNATETISNRFSSSFSHFYVSHQMVIGEKFLCGIVWMVVEKASQIFNLSSRKNECEQNGNRNRRVMTMTTSIAKATNDDDDDEGYDANRTNKQK